MTDRAELTSDTPRTDAAAIECSGAAEDNGVEQSLVGIRFARQLERELAALEAKLAAAEADAERYRWLRDTLHGAKAGGGVEVNDALQVYEQPIPGEEVRVYWYQDTPVGFYQSHGTTLDEAIDSAREGK